MHQFDRLMIIYESLASATRAIGLRKVNERPLMQFLKSGQRDFGPRRDPADAVCGLSLDDQFHLATPIHLITPDLKGFLGNLVVELEGQGPKC